MTQQEEQPEQSAPGDSARKLPRPVSFEELAGGQAEVIIEHKGQQYRLRTTRNGGLILNK
ncbi:MAG: hemin uptake protein HemP [Fuerstiella sp.]